MTPRTTRAQRLAMPLARDVLRDLAAEHGGCIRPVQLRRTDLHTGQIEQVLVPCGHTLATVCPCCAERARTLRAAQCREGWHLDTEPVITPDPADDEQRMWIEHRAETQQERDQAEAAGQDTDELDELSADLDDEITRSGLRGNVLPKRAARRHRSTRRRQDAPDLPRRPIAATTIGKTYTAPGGTTYRPSMFITLTCDSYGKVGADGTPADPDSYDYQRAARDALHFAALFDRLIQNLRRFLGYDLQYFAAVEPQKRLAPHVHMAVRGTISRTELRQVLAATYHQVWWPPADGARPWPDGPTTCGTRRSRCGSTQECPPPMWPSGPDTASKSCSASTPNASMTARASPTSASTPPCGPPDVASRSRWQNAGSQAQTRPDMRLTGGDPSHVFPTTSGRKRLLVAVGCMAQSRVRAAKASLSWCVSWWQVLGSNQRRLSRRFYRERPAGPHS